MVSRETGTSSCIALDRTKPLAPVWRENFKNGELLVSDRWPGDSTDGVTLVCL